MESLGASACLDAQVLHLNPLTPLEDEARAINDALAAPIAVPPLSQLARGRRNACIAICDITRPVPNQKILTPMLQTLEAARIARQDITILIATGLHRTNVGAELEEMLGADIARDYRVINHVAKAGEDMISLGEIEFMSGKTATVALNKHYLRADLKITTGLIEPHFMAGYSGGRKVICPGLASAQTITQFHAPLMEGTVASGQRPRQTRVRWHHLAPAGFGEIADDAVFCAGDASPEREFRLENRLGATLLKNKCLKFIRSGYNR